MKNLLGHLTPLLTWIATLGGMAYVLWSFAERLKFGLSEGQELRYELVSGLYLLPLALPALVGLVLLLRRRLPEDALLGLGFGLYSMVLAVLVHLHITATDPLELGLAVIVLGIPVSVLLAAVMWWRVTHATQRPPRQ